MTTRRAAIIFAVIVAWPPVADAQETAEAMLPLWKVANEACRGGPGDAAETRAACARRDHFTNRLSRIGLCYGKQGQAAADHEWHGCGPASNRLGR